MSRILLHICCAPCSIYPLGELRKQGMDVTGFFYNHNIHPYQEYRRRLDAVREHAEMTALAMVYRDEYALEEFLASVAQDPSSRCGYCYASRLEVAAKTAAELGFPAYTSSLLYSRYQQHEKIRELGESLGRKYGVAFHYDDYRRGWQEGIRISKELGLYRQQYCGCIYSEKERYLKAGTGDQGPGTGKG
ncbi:MAG: epoxyqueuosine reductase QueH [Geobacter sp.]|nr:epoxyqueuosine reductase QueH [Geobacter sp.]